MPDHAKTSKKDLSAGEQAMRILAAARREGRAADGAGTPKAEFLLKQANVLATLDLADAIRSSK
jgi:hypothetical protein